MSAFNLHERNMPFGEDRRVSTLTPPPDYLLRYFGFKLPELTLVLVLVALIAFVVRLVRLRRRSKPHRRALVGGPGSETGVELQAGFMLERQRLAVGGLLAFAILFPPLYAIIKRSPLYDGLRHFLFLVPTLTVIAGVTTATILRWVAARSRVASAGMATLVVAWSVRMLLVMIAIHPHQYLWFNQVIGGLPGAFLRYDTDYYGNTYKEGYASLREHLWETERERFLEAPYSVGACMPDFVADQYLGANFLRRRKGGKGDFWLGYTRNNCYLQNEAAPEFLQVEREGTLLLLVRDLRGLPPRPGRTQPSKPKSKPTKPAKKPAVKPTQPGKKPAVKPTGPAGKPTKALGKSTKPSSADPTGMPSSAAVDQLGPSE